MIWVDHKAVDDGCGATGDFENVHTFELQFESPFGPEFFSLSRYFLNALKILQGSYASILIAVQIHEFHMLKLSYIILI